MDAGQDRTVGVPCAKVVVCVVLRKQQSPIKAKGADKYSSSDLRNKRKFKMKSRRLIYER